MQVKCGDLVKMRDGRHVYVNDAADQDLDAYRYYDETYYERTGQFRIKSEMPVETIFVGYVKGDPNSVVVSDMSEVVSILE